MTVKKLTISQLPVLTELFDYHDVSAMLSACAADIQAGRIDIFVVREEGKVIGELRVKYESEDPAFASRGRRAYLYAFRILPACQGQGKGQYLLREVLSRLQEQGYQEFTVGVEDDDPRALHIYQAFGFREFVLRKQETYQGDTYSYNLYLKRSMTVG